MATAPSAIVSQDSETQSEHARGPLEIEEGTTIGRYVVLDTLGYGGMGVVLCAFDPQLDRKIALKLLLADPRTEGQARLQREAQAMARLSHPHVIKVHDVGTHEGRVFLAMELVEGQTLAQWIRAERRPWPEVLRVFRAAGEGLRAAHDADLVHRDFKPANVLIGNDGAVKVTDFGLARARATTELPEDEPSTEDPGAADPANLEVTLTRTGALVGTPAYMAPEQLDGRPADPRCDQFSFCVALYEALAGQRPFAGSNPWQLAAAIMSQRFAVPLPASLPRALRAAVRRGLAPDPQDRYPDLASLLHALRRSRWSRQRRASWTLASIAAVSTAAWAATRSPSPAVDYCADVRKRLDGVWDDARRTATEKAFLSTELSYASDAWTRARTRLDEQAEAWVVAQQEVCEARVALEDTPADAERRQALDLRTICLQGRLVELEQLGELLAEADAELVERVPRALDALHPIEHCQSERSVPFAGEGDGSDPILAEMLTRIVVLRDAGRHERALEVADAAAARLPDVNRWMQAEIWLVRGWAHGAAGHYEDAEHDYHEAFAAAMAADHDEIVLRAARGLALIEFRNQQPDFDEAARWIEHAQAALGTLEDRDDLHLDLAASLESTRGELDHRQGNYEAALSHFERALDLRRQYRGDDDPTLSASYGNLGWTFARLGRLEEAITADQKALEFDRIRFGDRHPQVARAMDSLGSSYSHVGEYDRALQLGTDAVRMLEETVGKSHPSLGSALVNLGSTQSKAGKLDAAERSFLAALENVRASFGPKHRRVGVILNNLGVHYEKTEQLAKAEDYHRRAVEVFEAELGRDHPNTAMVTTNLAGILSKRGKLDEAEAILRKTLVTAEERLGKEHPWVAHPLMVLAEVVVERERYAEARAMLERALALRESGQSSPKEVGVASFALGDALWKEGRERKRARELVRRAITLYEGVGEPAAVELAKARAWMNEHEDG